MGKSLFSVAAMYCARTSKRAAGTVLGVSSNDPGRIQLTHLSAGIIRASVIDRNEITEIRFKDVQQVAVCGLDGYADGKHMLIRMLDGTNHIFAFKKPVKTEKSVEALNKLRLAAQQING
jgi:hypothetical protein